MLIRKAERKKAKLRIGIAGAAGSGKTWSALEIASGLGKKIGMIDTESGRGELYGSDFDYDIISLEAPYSPERYIQAIKAFEKENYEVIIIDSLSHAWVGEGGVLSQVTNAGGNSFAAWGKIGTPKQNALMEAIISSKLHIITTLRVKSEYVVEKDEKGKNVPRKIGLSPVQRDGLEYEFTVFMEINQDHVACISKDNTKLFDQQYIKPTKEMGEKLKDWMESGVSQEDYLSRVVLPKAIERLNECSSIDDLAREFSSSKTYFKNDAELVKAYTDEKDKCKSKFMEGAA